MKEGTFAVLLQFGLGNEWWADSMECYCHLRNIQDLLSDGKTPYERRFGMPFNGQVLRKTNLGKKDLSGLFLVYALYAGGIWMGDIMVADIEELEEMDASELHARRLNAKEVLTPQRSGNFRFPVADGTVKIYGERTASENTHLNPGINPERGEEQQILRGKSGGLSSPSPQQDDSTREDEEAKSDFWTTME